MNNFISTRKIYNNRCVLYLFNATFLLTRLPALKCILHRIHTILLHTLCDTSDNGWYVCIFEIMAGVAAQIHK